MVCHSFDTPFCTCLSAVKLVSFCYFLTSVPLRAGPFCAAFFVRGEGDWERGGQKGYLLSEKVGMVGNKNPSGKVYLFGRTKTSIL